MAHILTAAVVGAGSGGRLSIQALAASDRYSLRAVVDLHEAARAAVQADFPAVQIFASHQELFAVLQPDVVCVSTWPPSHRAVTEAALAINPRGLLVEKPLADNMRDGAALLEAIVARNLPVVVPHGLLVSDHGRAIIELVRGGAIGDLRLVEIQCSGWDIINAGIHWLNFALALAGDEPVQTVQAAVDARTRTYRDGMQVETVAVTYAVTRSGVRFVMHTGDSLPTSVAGKATLFQIIGTAGTLEFYGWEPRYRLFNAQHPAGLLLEVAPQPRSGHQRYLELLADQIAAGTSDYTLARRSLAALEVCEAAYLSARYGCAIALPLAGFVPPTPVDWQPGNPYAGVGGGRDGRKL